MSLQDLKKLSDPGRIERLNQAVDSIVVSDSISEAKKLAVFLSDIFSRNPEFIKDNPALYNTYNNYLAAAKYVIIFDLEEKEIINLIRENFSFVLDHPEYDLERKMNYKIRGIMGLEKRDIFKKEIKQALLKCNAILGKNKILINGEKHTATVGNWLKDYYIKVGIEKVDVLKLNEYLVNSGNIKLLSPEERIKLKKLLDFFESMKILSTQSPMASESFVAILPNGEISLMSDKKMEVTPPNISKLYDEVKNITNQDEQHFDNRGNAAGAEIKSGQETQLEQLKKLLAQYPAGSLERKAIEEEMRKLESGIRNKE